MAMFSHQASRRRTRFLRRLFVEPLEDRRLLAVVTLDPNIEYQTIQGWGTAAVYPTNLVTIAQAGAIMRDAGMNVVRVTPGPGDYTYTVGGNMTTPVPISANLDENVARFYPGGNDQTDLINWLQVNALEPDRVKMIGSLWSPPDWMKITTGTLMNWDNGGPQSGYDPIIPWGDYGGNTGGGRVNPAMWTDWARYVLSTIKSWEEKTGLPMYAFSFQNEPNVPATYNSAMFDLYRQRRQRPQCRFHRRPLGVIRRCCQALANERALHPEITTKFFGPELSQLGGGASNPYNLPSYNAVRQNLISRGLLDDLGAWATHEYTNPADSAAMWDAWYNGSAHAAQIINGTNNLGWLGPTPGIAGDNKEIWQTETEGEDQTWTKDGAMGFGLKMQNALVYGNVSGYTSWTLTGYSSSDSWGLVDLDDINNPTNSYKYDAMKQFSRYISSGASASMPCSRTARPRSAGQMNWTAYNGLTVSAYKQAQDQRLTMVFTNMKTSSESTTITIPAGLNVSSFQVFVTSGTQKFAQLADLVPSGGQISITIPASSFVTITGLYGTPSAIAPNAPAGLSGTVVTNRRIDLSWTDKASNETSFFLERATNSSFTQNLAITTLGTNATRYQDSAVGPSTTYFYRIRATIRPATPPIQMWLITPPPQSRFRAAPTSLNGTVVSSSRIDLSWMDNASNETSFAIDRATNSSFTQNLVTNSVGSNVTSYHNTGLSASTTYYYRVRASNIDGYSGYTNVVNYTTPASTSIFTSNVDIGSPSPSGSGSYNSSSHTYTVAGGGADIWGSSDQFHFLSQSFTGNGTIIARVESLQNTNVSAKGGVMFRNSTAANAAYAFAWVTPSGNVVFETRSASGASSGYSSTVSGVGIPVWVRLVRSGNQFSASYSPNGTSWIQVGTTQSVTMATNAQAGLAVTSHTNGTLCTSVFSNVSVTSSDSPLPDYNGNGVVDAADYVLWRKTLGSTTNLLANGDDTGPSAGIIDQADYAVWRTNFGNTAAAAGSGSAQSAVNANALPVVTTATTTALSSAAVDATMAESVAAAVPLTSTYSTSGFPTVKRALARPGRRFDHSLPDNNALLALASGRPLDRQTARSTQSTGDRFDYEADDADAIDKVFAAGSVATHVARSTHRGTSQLAARRR